MHYTDNLSNCNKKTAYKHNSLLKWLFRFKDTSMAVKRFFFSLLSNAGLPNVTELHKIRLGMTECTLLLTHASFKLE